MLCNYSIKAFVHARSLQNLIRTHPNRFGGLCQIASILINYVSIASQSDERESGWKTTDRSIVHVMYAAEFTPRKFACITCAIGPAHNSFKSGPARWKRQARQGEERGGSERG